MSAPTTMLRDSKHFTGLSFVDDDNEDSGAITMSSTGVVFGVASDLRVGKFCIINGFPCRIRDIQRSAPGKHGHAKLRVVGVGLFDQRKRETIFSAHQQVLIPKVETRSNILGTPIVGGLEILENKSSQGLGSVLSYGEEDKPHEGTHFVLSVVIACGHFCVTGVRAVSQEEAADLRKMDSPEVCTDENPAPILSKKEQRKQRKMLKKREAVAPVD